MSDFCLISSHFYPYSSFLPFSLISSMRAAQNVCHHNFIIIQLRILPRVQKQAMKNIKTWERKKNTLFEGNQGHVGKLLALEASTLKSEWPNQCEMYFQSIKLFSPRKNYFVISILMSSYKHTLFYGIIVFSFQVCRNSLVIC